MSKKEEENTKLPLINIRNSEFRFTPYNTVNSALNFFPLALQANTLPLCAGYGLTAKDQKPLDTPVID